ncbi:MAG: M20/M25/M40 family metallo-hydrolase [Bacteroidetes bacterium]|nr:M20/M25/M40 family metallo-hydrolase [Bacteroidota bacterium]
MKKIIFPSFPVLVFAILSFSNAPHEVVNSGDNDSTVVSKIFRECMANGEAYENLRGLCIAAPKRLSGSPGAQAAVEYMKNVMDKCGFDKVWLQPCMVPHWVRGNPEFGAIKYTNAKRKDHVVNVCALGGSVATPKEGLTGEIVEVQNWKQLDSLGKNGVQGKIVFYNHRWDDKKISTFAAYGETVDYRWDGAHRAEQYGAIGSMVRSCTSSIDTFPHTGTARNDSLMAKIPAVAIATKDADFLHNEIIANGKVKFILKMNCQWMPDEKSYNVIGEIIGSEHPEQVIVVGGHLDAWELGAGANDDGAGVVQSVEAIRLFKQLGIRPKHTIRCVAFMNEENGGRGGKAYADSAKVKNEKHIAAIESDAGGFTPRGFGTEMDSLKKIKIQSWRNLFLPYGVYDFDHGGGGADIGPLKTQGTPLLGLQPDGSRYFDYHHTEDDQFKNVNRRELHMGAASMAAMLFLIDKYGL